MTQKEIADCIRVAMATDVGMRRNENQDSYSAFSTEHFSVLMVADGMGGVQGGAKASKLALQAFTQHLCLCPDLNCEAIQKAISHSNGIVYTEGQADPACQGMGTTFVGVALQNARLYLFNVGDSRAYRLRGGRLQQLTQDHTLVMDLIRAGALSPEQAEDHPISHMLTRSLGPSADVYPDCGYLEDGPARGDRYLLCSDGLYNMLHTQELEEILSQENIEQAAKHCVEAANDNGGADNISIILIEFLERFPITLEAIEEDLEQRRQEISDLNRDTLEVTATGGENGISDELKDELRAALALHSEKIEIENKEVAETPEKAALVEDREKVQSPFITGKIKIDAIRFADPPEPRNKASVLPEAEHEAEATENTDSSDLGRRAIAKVGIGLVLGVLLTLSAAFFLNAGSFLNTGSGRHIPSSEPPRLAHQTTGLQDLINSRTPPAMNQDQSSHNPHSQVSEQSHPIQAPPVQEEILPKPEAELQEILSASGLRRDANVMRPDQMRRRLHNTQQRIAALEDKISALQGDHFVDAQDIRVRAEKKREKIISSLQSLREKLDMGARKVSVWYARKKRIQQEDALRLAGEVAVSSETVREAKDVFEQITWDYLQTTEKLRFQPDDMALQEEAGRLAELRKNKLELLEILIVKEIDVFIDRSHEEIISLTNERDDLERELSEAQEDVRFSELLAEPDEERKKQFLQELYANQEIARAQERELRALSSTVQEE